MSDDVLIKVDNVSKRFCRSLKRSLWYGLQDLGSELGGRRHGGGSGLPQSSADVELRKDEFWAVKDVSFELRRGECLGLIGRNGAGKTTLLRMLNGLIKPDTGEIKTSGHIGALIALGSGFNPVLTGRENIYIGGAILGLTTAEINKKIDEIIDFSEIEDFIDSPVQSYSSGMQARLGFAVVSSLNPDILLVDEILSVGDASFREKCYARLAYLKMSGCGFVLVAHSELAIVNHTDCCCLLEKGCQLFLGDTQNALIEYKRLNAGSGQLQKKERNRINLKRIQDKDNMHLPFIESIMAGAAIYGKFFKMELGIIQKNFEGSLSSDNWILEVYFSSQSNGTPAFTISCDLDAISKSDPEYYVLAIQSPTLPLFPGSYTLKAWIRNTKSKNICSIIEGVRLNVSHDSLMSETLKSSFSISRSCPQAQLLS